MKKRPEFLTPTEVLDKYPELAYKFGWTAQLIGVLLKARILSGTYSSSLKKSLVNEKSVVELATYCNEKIEREKVCLNHVRPDSFL
jgi:hypothetical protein